MLSIASEDEQLSLFTADRLPKKPYCKDGKAEANLIRSLKSALKKPYIQVNPPHLKTWLVFDVDRPNASGCWEDVLLPPPAWSAANKENGHAHLAYGLTAPVLAGEAARDKPLRYLAAIENAMRAKLGADPGFNGIITKNPKHETWRTQWGPLKLYELHELAEYVDLAKHMPKNGLKVENVGLGRNCTLFDRVRLWAYKAVRDYRRNTQPLHAWNAWLDEVRTETLMFNGDFSYANGDWFSLSGPLSERECFWIAKSVATWTWRKDKEAEQNFIERQRERGRLGGKIGGKIGMESRWGNNEDKVASAKLMAAAGKSQRAIAKELEVALYTVVRWLKND